MKNNKQKARIIYAVLFALLLIIEILIALFVKGGFVRSYGGDILVTILICCFVRIFFPEKCRLLAVWAFLFSAAVEVMQYFDFVRLIGLYKIEFFRILLGTTFSFIDLVCYAAGCAVFFVCEKILCKKS